MGILENGSPITLDGCVLQNLSSELSSGLCKSIVRADLALIGKEYGKREPVSFSELRFSMNGLDAWLSISGIQIERDTANNRGSIRFGLPDEIQLTLPNGG